MGRERQHQIALAKILVHPKLEVRTPAGVIDILTDDEIYELKTFSGWRGAIGQLCAYGYIYPDHKKVLILFDAPLKEEATKLIRAICETLNIQVTLMELKA